MKKLKFEITLGKNGEYKNSRTETYIKSFEEIMDIFYDDGYGISEAEIIEILENKNPMYEVKMIIK